MTPTGLKRVVGGGLAASGSSAVTQTLLGLSLTLLLPSCAQQYAAPVPGPGQTLTRLTVTAGGSGLAMDVPASVQVKFYDAGKLCPEGSVPPADGYLGTISVRPNGEPVTVEVIVGHWLAVRATQLALTAGRSQQFCDATAWLYVARDAPYVLASGTVGRVFDLNTGFLVVFLGWYVVRVL